MKDLVRIIYVFGAIFVLMASYVCATATNPTGPANITRESDSRFSEYSTLQVQAEAGNLTELTISGLTQTQSWQGYFGNITGTITLDDAYNNTMYDWYVAEPQGEIYASNGSTVTWSNIHCVNYNNSFDNDFNLSILETFYGIASDDQDGFNETFNVSGKIDGSTNHPIVYVGTNTIAAGTCPATDTYESDSEAGGNFIEILLSDNSSVIFTTIIENDVVGNDTEIVGFNGNTYDFQLLVAEDGHDGDDIVTPYYFFVELE